MAALQPLTDAKIVDLAVNDVADRYEVGDMLGEGRFSQVFSATRGSKSVALKVVEMSMLEEDEEAVEALVQEVTALRKAYAATSKHVPRVHEVLQTSETIYVVMDQVKGCELFEMLGDGPLSESSARRLVAQLLSALAALHRHNVVHRDVKPENLMVCDVDDPRNCRLVMIDFGYAAIGSTVHDGLDGLAGSPEYAAPEVLTWLDGDGQPYGKACDMWSVGVTAYVLLAGELPYDFPEEGDMAEHVRTAPLNFSKPCWAASGAEGEEGHKEMLAAQDFVRACMQVDDKARLTAKQGLQHRWFAPRADDGQSVAIGASMAAIAALQRRVPSLSMTDTPKRVMRWFGRLSGRRPMSPTKQQFWELKLGMPPMPEEQDAPAAGSAAASPDARLRTPIASTPLALSLPPTAAPTTAPLGSRPLTLLNAPPEALASARKAVNMHMHADVSEEMRIKMSASPRSTPGIFRLGFPLGGGAENSGVPPPMPSPRRALFLAPSPRAAASEQLARRAAPPTPNAIAPPPMAA